MRPHQCQCQYAEKFLNSASNPFPAISCLFPFHITQSILIAIIRRIAPIAAIAICPA